MKKIRKIRILDLWFLQAAFYSWNKIFVIVVVVVRVWSGVYRLSGSGDLSETATTLGDSFLLHAYPARNRFAGKQFNNNDSGNLLVV